MTNRLQTPNERLAFLLIAFLVATFGTAGKERAPGQVFKYVGGTEDVASHCEGRLQLAAAALNFRCAERALEIPYTSISLMQYRPDVSPQLRKMNLNWKVEPPHGGGKKNRYFSLVYNTKGRPHAIVLEVSPGAMRPYLAEIDLKSGKRVEVRGFEKYD
jgi:hypothetical protein